MGSKSSSGSLLKSVESMLPKNMNMKHVLLAVLVGLLLCMLMGQSVEGIRNIEGSDMTGTTNGICQPTSFYTSPTRCVVDTYNASSASESGAAALGPTANATLRSAMNNACGLIDDNKCSNANTLASSDSSNDLKSQVRQHNATQSDDTTKVGGQGGIDSSYFSCKLEELDVCSGQINKNGCESKPACSWGACSELTNIPHFGPAKADDASLDTDVGPGVKSFNTWRKCLFTNNTSPNYSGTPKIDAVAQPSGQPAIRAKYPLQVPAGAGAGLDGQVLTAQSSGSARIIDEGGNLSIGKIPGNGGQGVQGLTGWLRGVPGVPLANTMTSAHTWTEEELKTSNAIPLDENGKITAGMREYLPQNLKEGIENMFVWCGYGLTDADKNNVAVGWGDDLRSLKCLNNNPNISSFTTQSHKTRYPCVDISSQGECRKKTGHTTCSRGEEDSCYSLTPPTFTMVGKTDGIGNNISAGVAAGAALVQTTTGKALDAVAMGVSSASQKVKGN